MFNVNERITYYKSLLADYSEEQLQELKRLGQKEHLQELYKEFIGHRMDVEKRLKQILTDKRIPGKATVGADYVGRLFNCSPEAVVRGRFGTGAIPRCRLKPVGFKKADVERVFRERLKSAKPLRADEEKPKVRALVRRKKSE